MLKLIAAILMLADHIGFYFYDLLPDPLTLLLRTAGRLAFPVFAWLVARGFTRTRHPLAYFIRMTIFAGLSEVIIRYGHHLVGLQLDGTNILITFALALVMLSGYRLASHSYFDMIASLKPVSPSLGAPDLRYDVRINPGGIELDPKIGLPIGIIMMLIAAGAALILKPDYGLYGLLAVLLFHVVIDRYDESVHLKRSVQGFIVLNAFFLVVRIFILDWPVDWAVLQCFAVIALPVCFRLDHDRRPGRFQQYFFYLFYPIHIFLLCLIRLLIG